MRAARNDRASKTSLSNQRRLSTPWTESIRFRAEKSHPSHRYSSTLALFVRQSGAGVSRLARDPNPGMDEKRFIRLAALSGLALAEAELEVLEDEDVLAEEPVVLGVL